MVNVFLSASVPLPDRDRKFFDSADVLAIREAIKGLVEVVLPTGQITCGGHPAITPLLALFTQEIGVSRDHVTVYQSALFAGRMPAELKQFVDVRVVEAVGSDRDASLTRMREAMIRSSTFDAAVVIGGMEGIFEEVALFQQIHPKAQLLPLASTGAAASIVHAEGHYDERLATDLTYSSLFRRRLLKQ